MLYVKARSVKLIFYVW